ncbi:MAG: hypothetical protein ACE5HC_09260 [Candidatus Binatia bacterium]
MARCWERVFMLRLGSACEGLTPKAVTFINTVWLDKLGRIV